MRRSKSLPRIRAGEPVRICSLGHFIPAYIRMAAELGFDCIWLDTEHRALDDREIQTLLAYFHLFDIDCLLRTPTLEKAKLYRYLEDGATGLMIPHVSTPERAQQLVQAVKFPPLGDRGLDGVGLDAGFLPSSDGYDGFMDHANSETFLVVQIETPEAVRNVDAIAAVEGVDGLFVGPGDLGVRLRRVGAEFTLEEAFQRAAAAAKKYGKAWGSPALSPEHLRYLRDAGAQLIANGGDYSALLGYLQQKAVELDEALGKRPGASQPPVVPVD